jgi:hypothetical protein
MSSAIGMLRWSPETFWRATMFEYTAGMKGHMAANGVDLTPGLTVDDVKELQDQHEKRLRKARMRGHQA